MRRTPKSVNSKHLDFNGWAMGGFLSRITRIRTLCGYFGKFREGTHRASCKIVLIRIGPRKFH